MGAAGSPAPEPTTLGLAVQRTRLALERTLMAWVRTALSMISFGFSIYKLFDGEPGRAPVRPESARELALALIAIGTVGLVLATWQHGAEARLLPADPGAARSVARPTAWMLVLVGITAFAAVLAGL